jgi:hypothetical protein
MKRTARLPWPRSLHGWLAAVMVAMSLLVGGGAVAAAPGLCIGPVCGDEIARSDPYPWQLRMRLQDQWGHRERLLVDCRDGSISPLLGPVERGYAGALAKRACRQAPLLSLPRPGPTPKGRTD